MTRKPNTLIDARTGRPYGDHGTVQNAVDFILSDISDMAPGDAEIFLADWRDGSLEEWPEYYSWLKAGGF